MFEPEIEELEPGLPATLAAGVVPPAPTVIV
jgi:hypothetical protein